MTSLYPSPEHSEKYQGGEKLSYIYPEAAMPDDLIYHLSDQERERPEDCNLEKGPVHVEVSETPKTPAKI